MISLSNKNITICVWLLILPLVTIVFSCSYNQKDEDSKIDIEPFRKESDDDSTLQATKKLELDIELENLEELTERPHLIMIDSTIRDIYVRLICENCWDSLIPYEVKSQRGSYVVTEYPDTTKNVVYGLKILGKQALMKCKVPNRKQPKGMYFTDDYISRVSFIDKSSKDTIHKISVIQIVCTNEH